MNELARRRKQSQASKRALTGSPVMAISPNSPNQSYAINVSSGSGLTGGTWQPIGTTSQPQAYTSPADTTVYCAWCYKQHRVRRQANFQVDGTMVCASHCEELLTIIHEDD